MANIKATIITIGDELLIGQTIDTNSAWMAQRLNELGILVQKRIAVGDNADEIKQALDEEIPRASVVLLTGGLGPTADDITKPLLCEYFNGKLVVNEQVLEHVRELFVKRNRPFLERNIKQAEVPDVCTVLHNKVGTAPGMLFEKNDTIIISMPGVPFEMMSIMTDEVLPLLGNRFVTDCIVHKTIITSGEGESFIAEAIQDLEEALPAHIGLAYLPSPGVVKLRLTGTGNDEVALTNEVELHLNKIAERLNHIVIAREDIPFQVILSKTLLDKKATISLAESCTGGYIAHLITQVQGSSNYFRGGIVPYQSAMKEKMVHVDRATLDEHGAISEPTAIELAVNTRALFESDYCLSVTGQLSYGGEDAHVPQGEVWMAVAGEDDVKTKKYKFHYDKAMNKEHAAQMGMLMLWKFITGRL